MFSLRSKLRRDLLTHFFMNRSSRVYVRQLAGLLGVDPTNLSRELSRLEAEGLVRSEVEGRQRYYSINSAYPYLKPLFTLLRGSIGIEPTLKRTLRAVDGIQSASIYGSFAKNEADGSSDIDLFVVGEPDQMQLASQIRRAERILRREINYTVLGPKELQRKLKARDAFIRDLWSGKRIELIGDEQNQAAEDRSQAGQAVSRRRGKESRRRAQEPQHR
jgi:DNA-binding transcriptional ArsR family regulator